jgi:hypothetical protein
MNRKVMYKSACVVEDRAIVVDDCGYAVRVDLGACKMEDMKKISENGIDYVCNVL